MSLPEFFYAIAFSTYMVGALFTFRNHSDVSGIFVMTAAVIADFLITVAPVLGIESLAMQFEGANKAVVAGSILGFSTWTIFGVAMWAWFKRCTALFLSLVLVTQLVWFACYLSFVYGMHVYPAS